jgi:MFS family permease
MAKNLAVILSSRTLSSLHNPGYRTYFLGVLGQFASMSMSMVVNSLLIYRLTGSSAMLGTVSLANAFPMLITSLFGGAFADRVQKKRLLMFGMMASSMVSLAIAIALVTGFMSEEHEWSAWLLVGSSFLMGCIFGVMMPARQAIIPELVSREQTMNAVALNMLGMNTLILLGPAVAGFMIDAFDFASTYFAMTGLTLYGSIMIGFVKNTSPVKTTRTSILGDIRDGFSYIRRDRTIMFVLGFTTLAVVFSMPFQQLLPIYTEDILKVGATGLGLLLSVSGVGALVASLALASLPNRRRGIFLLSGGIVLGLGLLAFAFSSAWILSLVTVVFIGLGQTMRGTLGGALLQSYTEPAYMGRVMSLMMMQFGVMSIMTFIAGITAEYVPVQYVVGGLATILLISTMLSMAARPDIRRLD